VNLGNTLKITKLTLTFNWVSLSNLFISHITHNAMLHLASYERISLLLGKILHLQTVFKTEQMSE